jgi:hypothetical protein
MGSGIKTHANPNLNIIMLKPKSTGSLYRKGYFVTACDTNLHINNLNKIPLCVLKFAKFQIFKTNKNESNNK